MDSQILGGKPNFTKQLSQWVPANTSWSPCYRATRDGWLASTFHSNCDYKGATVAIVRVGSYIFGGYADVPWGSGRRSAVYKESLNCFIFSFVNKDNIKPFKSNVYRYRSNAIYSRSDYGPTFGTGGADIHIANNAGSSTSSRSDLGWTYRLPNGYKYIETSFGKRGKSQALLAGSYRFTPSEVEVFYVT